MCGCFKPPDEWYPSNKSWCKSCTLKKNRDYKKKIKERTKEIPISKQCSNCKKTKIAEEFNNNNLSKGGLSTQCKECLNLKDYEKRLEIRIEVLYFYSEGTLQCDCCKENELDFLCIDHVLGNGNKHRREIPKARNIYVWLKQNGFPSGYRVLCYNCNNALGFYGYCPHKKKTNKYNKALKKLGIK